MRLEGVTQRQFCKSGSRPFFKSETAPFCKSASEAINRSSIAIRRGNQIAAQPHCRDAVQVALVVSAANASVISTLRAGCHFYLAPTFCARRRAPAPIPQRSPSGAAASAKTGKPALCREGEAAAGGAQHQLLRHLLLGEIDEVLAAAMHWQHMLDIELLQLRHHLAQIIVGRRGEVKAADQRVDLLDPADLLRPPQGIDDAGMAAGADHDEAAVADAKAGGVLVPVLVGLWLAGQLVLGEMVVHVGVRVAPQAILDADLDPTVRQNVLDAGARHRAGRESVAFDHNGNLRQYGLDIQCAQSRAIQYAGAAAEAAVGAADDPPTENVFTAGVEAQILAHSALRLQEAEQTTEMIVMAMAQDQCVDRGDIDLQQLEIVGVDIGGEAEIQEVTPRLAALLRFDMQRQPPFAVHRPAFCSSRDPTSL